ncbi:MAG: MBL fold metallo-hydrolase [Phototrophicales bacterium]|nr:MAG: MBL fold metallo-hydrolase [Phototrophicales bacterium]
MDGAIMIQIGDMSLHLINDSQIMSDAGGVFGLVPRALYKSYAMPDADNLLPSNHHCLYVEAHGKKILVDVGYGDKLTDKQKAFLRFTPDGGRLLDALARLGVSPAEIDLVINTHLHNDHAGGNTAYAPDGEIVPVFPNAEYVVQRREYEDAMRPNERTRATYLPMNYQPLVERGQMRLLDGDTELLPGIFGIVTPGHTPGHMSIRFESGGQQVAFVCDMATYAIHFERLGWMTAYDVEPLITLETKRVWQAWALETSALLIFPHDPFIPAGRLAQMEDGKPQIIKLEVDFV